MKNQLLVLIEGIMSFQMGSSDMPWSRFMHLLVCMYIASLIFLLVSADWCLTFMKVKTPISRDQAKGVIYRIPCECGQEYIGETSKSIHERIAEHRRSVRRGDTNNSIAVHVQTTDHIIKWENAEVLQREQQKTRRKIKEAMYIQTSRCMNLDQGMSLDPIWNDIIPSINTNN